MPCKGKISSPYGWRIHPVYHTKKFHDGIDIAVPVGTPVKAVYDGIVLSSGPAKGYGYWVEIQHNLQNGSVVTSEYGHLSSWNVKQGQIVKKGDIIAKSGNSGASTGPHLHLTIRKIVNKNKKIPVDPSNYIFK